MDILLVERYTADKLSQLQAPDISTFQVVIFKLSPESGERVGLSLTILLAYAVYLTLISEDIPQTSLSASILCKFVILILSHLNC